ncbi:MAG: ankyrin repeat domain-containing protein [Stellaceae bacterium]
MKTRRLAPILLIALTGAVLGLTGPARAQLDPFAALRNNVARAAASGDTARVQVLVGTGNNPNETDDSGYTGLQYAAMNGNLAMITVLVKAGARIDQRDPLGNTPLCLAAARRQDEAAKLLIASGANLNAQNHDGMTPLMLAAQHGDLDLVRLLLAHGANPRKLDFTGRDAASWALDSHRPAVVAAIRRALAEAKR